MWNRESYTLIVCLLQEKLKVWILNKCFSCLFWQKMYGSWIEVGQHATTYFLSGDSYNNLIYGFRLTSNTISLIDRDICCASTRNMQLKSSAAQLHSKSDAIFMIGFHPDDNHLFIRCLKNCGSLQLQGIQCHRLVGPGGCWLQVIMSYISVQSVRIDGDY